MRKNAVVAGTGFEERAGIIRSHCKNGAKALFVRETDNEHDENAIAVYIEFPILFGLLGKGKAQIGYVKSTTAKSLAKRMDEGTEFIAKIDSFYAPRDKEFPRVTIEITDEV